MAKLSREDFINSLKDEYWNERVVGCKNVISYIK